MSTSVVTLLAASSCWMRGCGVCSVVYSNLMPYCSPKALANTSPTPGSPAGRATFTEPSFLAAATRPSQLPAGFAAVDPAAAALAAVDGLAATSEATGLAAAAEAAVLLAGAAAPPQA